MLKEDFLKLIPGQYIYDPEFNTYGQVVKGSWDFYYRYLWVEDRGFSIKWDDGDNSTVELLRHSDNEICKFELIDFVPS